MKRLKKNSMNFFWWLRKIMYLWVRGTVYPSQLNSELGIDSSKPIIYVLKSRKITDLLVLDHYCSKAGIARPQYTVESVLEHQAEATYIYLQTPGLIQLKESGDNPMTSRLKFLVDAIVDKNLDVQIIPVSIFWGRNPGREEKSLFKLLFFDDEHGGLLQRFITFFVQGRQIFCNFGKPIDLKSFLLDSQRLSSNAETAKKLRRLLKVHFRAQRESALGPYIYDRMQVIKRIISSNKIQELIRSEASRKKESAAKVEIQAYKHANEVASKLTSSALRFFQLTLSKLWKKIYDGVEVRNFEQVRELSEKYELVYMASHRSHMDYLLFGYKLYSMGLLPPHTVAGINLNFWPVGPLLRRGGAVFIRRSFKGDRLYGAVVSEFLNFLMGEGFPLSFYPEGGRSRTGYLLKPKIGILNMVLESSRGKSKKPVMLVPVYIGYDRIMEGRTYVGELHGKGKKRESFLALLKIRKNLRSKFGKAYLSFGEPLELNQYIEKNTDQREAMLSDSPVKFDTQSVNSIAHTMMVRINESAVISPVAFFSLVLLSSPRKAMVERDLLCLVRSILKLLEAAPFSRHVSVCVEGLESELKQVVELSDLKRYHHPSGDIIYIEKKDEQVLSYYSNNIIHIFVVPSLLCNFVLHHDEITLDHLVESCTAFYALIRDQLFLPSYNEEALREKIIETVNALHAQGLLICDSSSIVRQAKIVSLEFAHAKNLADMLSQEFERYAIFILLLDNHGDKPNLVRSDFVSECELMSKRHVLLTGGDESLFEPSFISRMLGLLNTLDYVTFNNDHIILNEKLKDLASMMSWVLSSDLRNSLKRI